jgi:hypothetical protein
MMMESSSDCERPLCEDFVATRDRQLWPIYVMRGPRRPARKCLAIEPSSAFAWLSWLVFGGRVKFPNQSEVATQFERF